PVRSRATYILFRALAANMMQQAVEYLEKVSLSNPDREEYNFKTLPRPKGKATKVIITEFDLPRKEAQPHDVVIDADGHAWYSDFGNQVIGELDSKTGKVSDYKLELLRPDQPKGSLDIEFDPDGNLWIGMSYQDPRTYDASGIPFHADGKTQIKERIYLD